MKRIPALDGLRGVAILLVVAHHAWPNGLVRFGGANGVLLFFVLSGYLITSILIRERDRDGIDLRAFYWRRTARLFPALGLVIVGAPVIYSLFGDGLGDYWRHILPVVTYTGSIVKASGGHMSVLTHTWSLAVEEHFYLVWPAVMTLLLPQRTRRFATGLLVVAVGWRVFLNISAGWTRTYWSTDGSAFALIAGCVLAIGLNDRPTPLPRVMRWVGVGGVVAASLIPGRPFTEWILWGSIPVVLLAVLAVWGCVEGFPALEGKTIRFFGTISYGLYLWHQVLYVGPFLSGWMFRSVILGVVSVGIAWASWMLLERPVLRATRSRQVTKRVDCEPSGASPEYATHSNVSDSGAVERTGRRMQRDQDSVV